uniref:Uncharacterized protein n=1 Tax=Cucumis melo TaxID=3656 RepID=A0A9I9EFH4_CUCME
MKRRHVGEGEELAPLSMELVERAELYAFDRSPSLYLSSFSSLLIHQKPDAKSTFITFFFSLASSLSLPFLSGVELFGEVFLQHSFYCDKKSKAAQLKFLKFSSSSSFLGSASSYLLVVFLASGSRPGFGSVMGFQRKLLLNHLLLSVDTNEKLGWAANGSQNGPENSC